MRLHPIEETPESKEGKNFFGANGSVIKNYGVREVSGRTEEGHPANIPIQAADVLRILASVRGMVHAGNKVVFDSEGSYIEHKKTGECMSMRDDGNMFLLKLWVKNASF